MKKCILFLISSLIVSNISFANSTNDAMRNQGIYVTLGAGLANTHYSDDIQKYQFFLTDIWAAPANSITISDSSLGGKVTIGYVLNKNFDTEFSYYGFGGAQTDNGKQTWVDQDGNQHYNNDDYSADQQALALTAVGRLPIGNSRSDLYAKAGLAYTWVTLHLSYSTDQGPSPSWNQGKLSYDSDFSAGEIAPLFGLGWEINLGNSWAMSAEWIEIIAQHKSIGDPLNSKIENASLYSLGVTYKFN